MRKRTRLYFKSIAEIVGGNGLGVITLTDALEHRAITVVCDSAMKYQIGLRSTDWRQREKLLPEVLLSMLSALTDINNLEMNIYAVIEGEYKVTLLDADNLHMNNIRLSDAVLLSRISDIPLYIDDELFSRQGSPYNSDSNRMAIPINTLPTDKLREELQKAVEREDYRLASVLNEELGKRKADKNATNKNETEEK